MIIVNLFLYSVANVLTNMSQFIGLQFCLSTEQQKIYSFAYGTLPGSIPTPLGWKICCKPNITVTEDHVIYYQLAEAEKSLADVVKKNCDNKPNVVGMIILHYEPSTFLPSDMLKGIPSHLPIIIVSCEDAEQLIGLDMNSDDGDLKVRVVAESDVDGKNTASSRPEAKGMFFYKCSIGTKGLLGTRMYMLCSGSHGKDGYMLLC